MLPRSECDRVYLKEERGVTVQLNWAAPRNTSSPRNRKTCSTARARRLLGREVAAPRRALLLLLCVNGAKDCGAHLTGLRRRRALRAPPAWTGRASSGWPPRRRAAVSCASCSRATARRAAPAEPPASPLRPPDRRLAAGAGRRLAERRRPRGWTRRRASASRRASACATRARYARPSADADLPATLARVAPALASLLRPAAAAPAGRAQAPASKPVL